MSYLCESVELPLMDTHSYKPGGRAGIDIDMKHLEFPLCMKNTNTFGLTKIKLC